MLVPASRGGGEGTLPPDGGPWRVHNYPPPSHHGTRTRSALPDGVLDEAEEVESLGTLKLFFRFIVWDESPRRAGAPVPNYKTQK